MFCTFYENRRFQTDALNDVFFTKMLQKLYVLLGIFMVEVKTTRDSRRRRLHKIVTTLERELHFDVFRLKFKNVVWRVRLVKPRLSDLYILSCCRSYRWLT